MPVPLVVEVVDRPIAFASANEGPRPAVDGRWALVSDAAGAALADAVGLRPLDGPAARLVDTPEGPVVVDPFASPRVLTRIPAAGPVERWSVAVPPHHVLDSFDVSGTLAGFVDLVLASEPVASRHRFWTARTDSGATLSSIELGDYVVIAGRPRCSPDACTVVGRPRYQPGSRLTAWTLPVDGAPSTQPLSTGAAWAFEAVGDRVVFVDDAALHVATFDGRAWSTARVIDGVARFSAAPDGDGLLLAWVPTGDAGWRVATLGPAGLGPITALAGVDADEALVLRREGDGLAVAAIRLVETHPPKGPPGTGTLGNAWTLSARFAHGRPPLTFSAPLQAQGEGHANQVWVVPFERDDQGHTGWWVQHPAELPFGAQVTRRVWPAD